MWSASKESLESNHTSPHWASRLHMWSGCPKARIRLPTEIGGAGSSKRLCREYGGSLRRVRRQANGLAYASTLGWMQVEPQQRNAHPSEEDQSGSMNLPTSVEERVKEPSAGSRQRGITNLDDNIFQVRTKGPHTRKLMFRSIGTLRRHLEAIS
jgi:hypothetical protein